MDNPTTPAELEERRKAWTAVDEQRLQWLQMTSNARRKRMLQNSASDPYDNIHAQGGTEDVWIMDDQTVICDPILINAVVDAIDAACQDPDEEE